MANSGNGGSATLRNVPDVAMEADFDNYMCSLGSCSGTGAGTSFAAPRWAGFMALINQQAVETGSAPKGGLGFITSSLYSLAEGANYSNDFHDVTSGNNNTRNQPTWFSAVAGYDLVTGWGSANGQALIDDLAGPQVDGFWILPTVRTVAINPGNSSTTTINVTDAAGFSGDVTLSVSSALPSGVTATWGTNPTSGSSLLTLTASASAPASMTTLTITGISGSHSATTTVVASVHAPTFLLAASPSSVGVNPGGTATSTILITPEFGFSDSVNLSVTGLPSGVTASFTPNPSTGNSVLTLTADTTATAGTSTLTITGTSGSLTVISTLSLVVHGPSFTLSSSGSVSVGQGYSTTTYVYVNSYYGFSGNVNLTVSGLPTGVTASFVPNPTTGSSTLTLTASSSAAVGQSTLTITGTSGSLTATTTLTLAVKVPTFTLYGSSALTIGQGTSGTAYFYVSPQYGFNGNVTFSVSGLPSGVTVLWNPNPSTQQSQLTLVASSSAAVGQYPLTITGTSGTQTATLAFTLGINVPTFTLSSVGSVDIGQGTSGTAYLYVNPQYGFTGSVNLSVSGLPSGVTGTFSPNPTTGSSTLTLTATSAAAVGSSTVTITGTSGSKTVTSSFTLGIHAPTYTLSGPGSINIGQGNTFTTYAYVNPQYGFTSSVNLTLSGLPAGVTGSFSPNPTTGYTQLTLTATGTATLTTGTVVTITGTSGSQTATTTFTLGVYAPTFTLYGSTSVSIGQGTTATSYVYVNAQYGFNGPVSLSVSGLPAGVASSFSPNPTTGNSVLTLTADASTAIGSYPLTITGTSGGVTTTTPLTLGVYTPTFTLSGYGATVSPGTSSTGYVYIYTQYGFTGSVNLSMTGLPSGVTGTFSPNPTTGSSTLTLTANSTAALGTYPLTVTGTSGGVTASTTLTLTVAAQSFTLSSSGAPSINEGSTGTAYVYVYGQNGFSGNVTLAASGLPSGVTAAFSPNPTTGNSTLTFTASSTATPGISTITVTGTSGSLTASTTMTLTVNTPGFSISDAPGNVMLAQGGSGTATVYITGKNAFSGSVTLAATGLPSGVSAVFAPNPTSAGSSVLTLTASSSASSGSTTIGITATSGALSATAPLTVTVGAASSATTTSLAVTAGGQAATTVAAGTVVTLSSAVSSGSTALTAGQVNFCDSTAPVCDVIHRIGAAQLTSGGTATMKFIPAMGAHSYIAVFTGVRSQKTSSSSAASLTVTASMPTTTTISASGGAGNYTLTSIVSGQGSTPPTGTVSFLDTSNSNFAIGSATLGASRTTLTWAAGSSVQTGTSPSSLATGDFNGDGVPDLAVGVSGTNAITILLGQGNGTFTAVSPNVQTSSAPTFVVVGDFNRDGKADLAVCESNGNIVQIFLGNGDGSFTASQSLPTGSNPAAIAAGDFSGDGFVDLAITNMSSSTVTVYLGSGDGTFTPSPLSPQTGSYPSAIVAADLNGDGIPDLAVANRYNNTVTVLLGNGDGSFVPATSLATGSYPVALAAGDFNGDGIPDLAVVNSSSNSATILLGNGDGSFSATSTSPQTGNNPYSITAADFNRDGKMDLAIVNNYGSTVTILLGNGDGTFAAGTSPTTSYYPTSIVAGDFNSDGSPDLAVMNSSYDTVSILTSKTAFSTTVSASGIFPAGQGTHAVLASYAGDSAYNASVSGTTNLTAWRTTPTVAISPSTATITAGQAIDITVTVNGGSGHPTPTGYVLIGSGTYNQQLNIVNGKITFTFPAGALPLGNNTVTALYQPDTAGTVFYTFATQQSILTVTPTLGGAVATVAVTPSASSITDQQSVSVVVAVAGGSGQATPTGTVLLSGGSYSAQQALSGGTTTFTIAAGTLSSGADALVAAYSGNATYASTSASTTITVSQVAATIASPTPVSPGSSATATVNLSAGSSYSGTLNLTCSLTQSPSGAQSLPTCSLSPATLTLSSGGSQSATLTVHTTAATTASLEPSHLNLWGIGGGSALAFVLMFGIPARRRRWGAMLVLLWIAVCGGSIGCGGGGGSSKGSTTPATTAGSYIFTVSGADSVNSAIKTSANVTVTVQ